MPWVDDATRFMIVATLCGVVWAVCIASVIGLYDTNVDNKAIFNLLTPPFNMIIGGMVGYTIGKQEKRT